MKMRIDHWLVRIGLAQSRSQAQALIKAGQVSLFSSSDNRFRVVNKSSLLVEPTLSPDQVAVTPSELGAYVSRGGLKLKAALGKANIAVKGRRALDVGCSTGGFSDCLLQEGAVEVVGVDVGHGQLSPSLVNRLRLIEGVNARHLRACELLKDEKFDLIVVDVSFISLGLVLPELGHFLSEGGEILALVKPQFELGAISLNKKGIVKDYQRAASQIHALCRTWCQSSNLREQHFFGSEIEGGDGNQEYFLHVQIP